MVLREYLIILLLEVARLALADIVTFIGNKVLGK